MNEITISWSVSIFCNLKCEYCIVEKYRNAETNKFTRLNLDSAIKFVQGFNSPVTIHFTGGEPLVDTNVVDFIEWLTHNGHTVTMNTNLTVNVDRFITQANFNNIKSVMISFHIEELLRTGTMSIWLANYNKIKKLCLTDVSSIAYPKYNYEDVDNFRKTYSTIPYNYAPYIGEYDGKTYPNSYTPDEIIKFGMEQSINYDTEKVRYDTSSIRYCYAGKQYFSVIDGYVKKCLSAPDFLGTIETFDHSKIDKTGVTKCTFDFCPCPNFSKTFYR